jgi:two-component system KDP operon response regulator KdpE
MPVVNGAIMFDPVRRRVERAGVEVLLTPREFDALQDLITHAGRPVMHAKLLAVLREPGCGNERTYLRVLIGQLRKQIEDDPANPVYVLTESHIGYRFRES